MAYSQRQTPAPPPSSRPSKGHAPQKPNPPMPIDGMQAQFPLRKAGYATLPPALNMSASTRVPTYDSRLDLRLRLPPLVPPLPSPTSQPRRHASKMDLANILSPQPISPTPSRDSLTKSSPSLIEGFPRDPRSHPQTQSPGHMHRLDRPPTPYGSPVDMSHVAPSHRPTSSKQPPVVSGTPSEDRGYSPAISNASYSSRSYRSLTSDPSPRIGSIDFPAEAKHKLPAKVSHPPPFDYLLSIRQQPIAARACGFGERDRRVIDPPPILELRIRDKATGAPVQDGQAMLALHCTLLSEDGQEDETELPSHQPDTATARRLMGTLVASPYQAKDEHNLAGMFFVFHDLSCRQPGKYRLRFKLLRIDPFNMLPGSVHSSVGTIVSDVFTVYTAKDFPGMRASSALLKALRRQGLNVGVKKGSDARKSKNKPRRDVDSSASDSAGDDDDYADGDDEHHDDDASPREGHAGAVSNPDTAKSRKAKKFKRQKRELLEHPRRLIAP